MSRFLSSKLTDEQAQKLLSLIETPKDNLEKLACEYDWLLDNGASYLIIENITLLRNLYDISPILVGMSNGAITFQRKRGSVKLHDKLSLSDVLYVPSLNYNLISIPQLIDEFCCIVIVAPQRCVIQDPTTKTLKWIG